MKITKCIMYHLFNNVIKTCHDSEVKLQSSFSLNDKKNMVWVSGNTQRLVILCDWHILKDAFSLTKVECNGRGCAIHQSCISGSCSCIQSCGYQYNPVCAYSSSNPSNFMTFSSDCEMRKAACNNGNTYYISKKGSCEQPGMVFVKISSTINIQVRPIFSFYMAIF